MLLFILNLAERKFTFDLKSNWHKSFFLFLYAITLSYSYLKLDAGLGALVLFACVQITIIIYAFIKKEDITAKKLLGMGLAFLGLIYLLFPKNDFSISSFHFMLMVVSGISWGCYTILGKSSTNVLRDTTQNFVKTFLFCLIFFIFFVDFTKITSYGVFLAFISGAITSGIGYTLWYYVLKHIEILTASVIQLLVPVFAIFLSVLFLGEKLTLPLIFSALLILSGIYISIYSKPDKSTNKI